MKRIVFNYSLGLAFSVVNFFFGFCWIFFFFPACHFLCCEATVLLSVCRYCTKHNRNWATDERRRLSLRRLLSLPINFDFDLTTFRICSNDIFWTEIHNWGREWQASCNVWFAGSEIEYWAIAVRLINDCSNFHKWLFHIQYKVSELDVDFSVNS